MTRVYRRVSGPLTFHEFCRRSARAESAAWADIEANRNAGGGFDAIPFDYEKERRDAFEQELYLLWRRMVPLFRLFGLSTAWPPQ